MCNKCNCENSLEKDIDLILKQNDNNGWFLVIFLILTLQGFKPEERLNRQTLVDQINKSDLSNSEKKRIIEILLG